MTAWADRRPVIGVLGGMGPAATADMLSKLALATDATKDGDHFRVIVDSDPAIPDRTAFVLGNGPSPAPRLIANARFLQDAGAELLVMACNTAHVVHREVQAAVSVPVLDLVREVVRAAVETFPHARRVGLLATTGTVRAGLYQTHLRAAGREVLLPSATEQEKVMASIMQIKGGARRVPRQVLSLAATRLRDAGATVVIAGCTEIPLVLATDSTAPVPILDSTCEAARATVRVASNLKGGVLDAV